MSDVFLSYKAEDRARIVPLVAALEAEGIGVWWDQHIGGGSSWREEIESNLVAARCVVVAWSERTVGPEGRFVRDEASHAQDAGSYVPVTIDEVRPPLGFRETQAIALTGWKGDRADPRFQALLVAVKARLAGEAMPAATRPSAAPALSQPTASRRAVMVGSGVGALALAGGAGWFLLGSPAQAASRIAVLPFRNMSGDAGQDYFAEGLAEELRGALSRVGLQVIGRTSSEAVADMKTSEIVDELDVSHILTGSVRNSPDHIRVSAQLVEGKDGIESWAQNYDRPPGEAIALQTDIATQVAQALSLTLGTDLTKAIELGGTKDPVAQVLVNQVLADFRQNGTTPENLFRNIARYEEAVQRDPGYAIAWIRLGSTRANAAGAIAMSPQEAAKLLAQAELEIRKGLAIAPTIGFGFSALAKLDAGNLRFRDCLDKHRQALAVAPNDPTVLNWAGNDLPFIGKLAESERNSEHLLSLDPLNPASWSRRSDTAYVAGRYAEAEEAARKALELSPLNFNSRIVLSNALAALGRFDEAVAALEGDEGLVLWTDVMRAIRAFRAGDDANGERSVATMRAEVGDFASYQYGQIYAQAGRIDEAFATLDTAITVKDSGLIFTMRDPMLKPLHKDPRFPALIKRLDFPVIDPQFA